MVSSTAPLIVSLILIFIVGQFGFSKISDVRAQVSSATRDQNVLNQKLSLLQTLAPSLSGSSNAATSALPDKNTSLAVISQVRGLGTANGVVISGIKGGAEAKDNTGLSRVDIAFEAGGTYPALITFLTSIEKVAPITLVSKIKLSEIGGAAKANVTVSSFWSAFPTKLPATTDQITDLTSDEKNTINKVGSLIQPQFQEIPPAGSGGKADPFAP